MKNVYQIQKFGTKQFFADTVLKSLIDLGFVYSMRKYTDVKTISYSYSLINITFNTHQCKKIITSVNNSYYVPRNVVIVPVSFEKFMNEIFEKEFGELQNKILTKI